MAYWPHLVSDRSLFIVFRKVQVVLTGLSALLNIQWARTGSPKTLEEKLIVWTTAIAGTLTGIRYFRARSYAGLGCLWVAPWMTAGAMLFEQWGNGEL